MSNSTVTSPSIKPVTADWPARISLDDWQTYEDAGLDSEAVTLWAVVEHASSGPDEVFTGWGRGPEPQYLKVKSTVVHDIEIRATDIDETREIELTDEQFQAVWETLNHAAIRARLESLVEEGRTV